MMRKKLDAGDGYILGRLLEDGPLKPSAFIGDNKMERHESTRRLAKLRGLGLIQRMPVEGEGDGRSLPYSLTQAGCELAGPVTQPEPATAAT